MKLLIKNARIVDPLSPFNGQTQDIFIENGLIRQIGSAIQTPADQEISIENLCISPGWVDVFSHFGDPGQEYKETIETGAAAAAAGGYTDVFLLPNTNPVVDSKAQVEYLRQRSATQPVNLHPIGAVTRQTEGKDLAEMYDMRASGAIAFSDGIRSIQSAGLLVKALQYIKAFGGIIIQLPDDQSISPHGLMNEGVVSTSLGLAGKPAMAEELIVARDIKLARYTESKLHLTAISTSKSVKYVNRGKASGIQLSCSVTPYHLYFNEESLQEYDTNLKVNPPIRTEADRLRLIEAVKDGTVDCIATHHLPHEADSKVSEFEYARNGMTGLETAFSVLNTVIPNEPERWVRLLSTQPRTLFGLPALSIQEGQKATLTLFDPEKEWTYTLSQKRSRSQNSPFLGKTLRGKVWGIINKDQLILNP